MTLPLDFKDLLKAFDVTNPAATITFEACQLRRYLKEVRDDQKKIDAQAVLDLVEALHCIGGKPSSSDLVKLAKRINR